MYHGQRSQSVAMQRLQVGDRAHRIVAAVLEAGEWRGRDGSPLQVAIQARRVFAARPIAYRSRAALVDSVTAASVYLHRLRPPAPWLFVAAERSYGDARFDVVWEHEAHGVLIDELKLGIGRAGEVAVRSQIDRQLSSATGIWPNLVGVRLCAVHEPAASRLYLPGRRRSVLVCESRLADELAPR